MNLLEWFISKDAPAPGDVHVSSTGQGKPKRPKGPIAQTTVLPVTGATMAAQQENPDDAPPTKKGFRSLKPNDDGETAHTPFPHDPNALGAMRQDQIPRFFGALTDPKQLPTRDVKLSDLTAMQDRVDPDKVEAIRAAGETGKLPVVVDMGGKHYIADGHHRAAAAWLDGKDEIPVKYKDLEERSNALKVGARNSAADLEKIQAVHDHAVALGARCGKGEAVDDDENQDEIGKSDDAWSIPFTVAKADGDQGLIFGWASVVEKDGHLVIDKQDDAILPEDLEKAANDFMLNARNHGDMHTMVGTGRCIESMVFTKDKQAALGVDLGQVGWWVGFKVDDQTTRAAIKRGELPEFSIGGSGRRVPFEEALEKSAFETAKDQDGQEWAWIPDDDDDDDDVEKYSPSQPRDARGRWVRVGSPEHLAAEAARSARTQARRQEARAAAIAARPRPTPRPKTLSAKSEGKTTVTSRHGAKQEQIDATYSKYFKKTPEELRKSLVKDIKGVSEAKSEMTLNLPVPHPDGGRGSIFGGRAYSAGRSNNVVAVAEINFKGPRGGQLGQATRVFQNTPEGLKVDHSLFVVSERAQSKGLGKQFLKNSMAEYKDMGVVAVSVNANINVGGYAWAKYGFVPSQASWDDLRYSIDRKLASSGFGSDVVSKVKAITSSSDPTSIRALSDLKDSVSSGGKQTSVGKALLLKSDWFGTLNMKDATSMNRFNAYVG